MNFTYVQVDNFKVPVYVEDNKKDTTFLFLHGLNSSSDFIKNLMVFNHNYNVVAPNLPGSKYFPKINIEDINVENWLKVAQVVLKQIKAKKVVIVAHSMSGSIAFKLQDKRIIRYIMLATINPSMRENKSYSVLQNVIKPATKTKELLGKFIVSISQKFNKTRPLVKSFSHYGRWSNLLANYVLDEMFMNNLDREYRENTLKTVAIIGQNDRIIGSDHFVEYMKELNVPTFIFGKGHSPFRNSAQEIANFLNNQLEIKNKRLPFWKSFRKMKQKADFEIWDDEDYELDIEEKLSEEN